MIREFKETDLNSIMRLWLETNISAHNFIDENDAKSNNIYL
jgi:putative acetyltransferase